ncbi:esterase/lipase family protein [Anaeromicropila populeti]|uniref:Triacylglycerol lipase n=1 Tax=Anaeromicropila populeti TaxID=37658 RepID=A0A1I6HT17_9FIRM|nr:triacylglycerol lipase [Anaeromicropila populeti]SFR57400.1 triacylglycerol lipase [Anaeromicropila populeti]
MNKTRTHILDYILFAVNTIIITVLANYPALRPHILSKAVLPCLILYYLFLNIVPSVKNASLKSKRLKTCGNGCRLLILFLVSTAFTAIYSIAGWFGLYREAGNFLSDTKLWMFNLLFSIGFEAIIFWNGIIRVYATSKQLGLRYRILGIVCGWIPIAHLAALGIIIHTASKEVQFENKKILCNLERKEQQICKTKYPLLLVHGVFFRDFRYFNYWGRIPKELENNGAAVYYGNQQSAASVEDCGKELAQRIQEIVEKTGCEKVNIIAHSKGGLDSRYAISMLGAAKYTASLTTINTPHRGCEFADYLLGKISEKKQQMIANAYNSALRKVGDTNPDFLKAVFDLTADACKKRNELIKDVEGVYYQSIGSKLSHALSGRFPLNFSYHLVNYFDGANDGLVGEDSFPWGTKVQFLSSKGNRGISHGDVIDLNRENINDFDVREFYVGLVKELKEMGY